MKAWKRVACCAYGVGEGLTTCQDGGRCWQSVEHQCRSGCLPPRSQSCCLETCTPAKSLYLQSSMGTTCPITYDSKSDQPRLGMHHAVSWRSCDSSCHRGSHASSSSIMRGKERCSGPAMTDTLKPVLQPDNCAFHSSFCCCLSCRKACLPPGSLSLADFAWLECDCI